MATVTSRPPAFDPAMAAHERVPDHPPSWDPGTERRLDDGETLARLLGWFSIGLGALELLAPDRVASFLGMKDRERLIELYGAREVIAGVGILNQRKPEGWIGARVAGDFLDLITLARGIDGRNRHRDRVIGAMAAVAGATALDILCLRQLHSTRQRAEKLRRLAGAPPDAGAYE